LCPAFCDRANRVVLLSPKEVAIRVLFTGSAGYLGQGIIIPFEQDSRYQLRLMDVRPFDSRHKCFVGDVADLSACRRAVDGVDALVIAHMAKNPDAYADPTIPVDVNVKGTANLFFAAHEAGIRRVVLVSSTSAAGHHGTPVDHTHPIHPTEGLYAVTKALQEVIAEYFSRQHRMSVAALRIGYVTDAEAMLDKYGRKITERSALLTDRRDIGEVARLCLEQTDISWEVFNVMSTRESLTLWDVQHTCRRLNWRAKYDFSWLPLPEIAP
jgi:nucleoside-diphosphate-sugar epimerase